MRGGLDPECECCCECAHARCRRCCAGAPQLRADLPRRFMPYERRFVGRGLAFSALAAATPAAPRSGSRAGPGASGGVERGLCAQRLVRRLELVRRFAAQLQRLPTRQRRAASRAGLPQRACLPAPASLGRWRASAAGFPRPPGFLSLLASGCPSGPAGSPRPWPLTPPGGLRRTRRPAGQHGGVTRGCGQPSRGAHASLELQRVVAAAKHASLQP